MNRYHLQWKWPVLAAGFLAVAFTCGHALAADSPRPEISFVVQRLAEKNVEGPDVERSFFWVGGKRMVFGLPKGFRLTGGDSFLLVPADPSGFEGEIRVSRSPFSPELDLATNALQYRDAASQDMPQGANHIEVQQPVLNPYPYNGWKSLGFTWTYSRYGQPMVRTISYINLGIGVQIVVTTMAGNKSAAEVAKVAKQFMSSWWVMGDSKPGTHE